MLFFIKKIIFLIAYIIHRNVNSKVIYYHDLSQKYTDMGTDFNLFKKHISIIRECGYKIVPGITEKKNEVMICFDDGWAGIYDYKDYFASNDIRPTIFIAVDLIGEDGYLNLEQLYDLARLGFNFECHTWSHQDLTSFDDKELIREIKDSKLKLESLLNKPINAICFPMGRFSLNIFNMCKDVGYIQLYSSICGGYNDYIDKGIICRVCAQFSSPTEFRWMLNSTSSFFRRRFIKQQYVGNFNHDFY